MVHIHARNPFKHYCSNVEKMNEDRFVRFFSASVLLYRYIRKTMSIRQIDYSTSTANAIDGLNKKYAYRILNITTPISSTHCIAL